MLNTYAETVDFLYAQLPEFQRTGAAAYKPGLENTLRLLESVGNPQHRFKSIHVAGTNGKGSTSHSLASILQEAGYKTGLYTSPHLVDFRERIRIDGKMIPEQAVVEKISAWLPVIEEIKPSFFELTVALAFVYFAENQVDIAVVEVGMGGRLDSTNVILPELCIITNISFDHQQFLGNTLPLIAEEKAGIIKPGKPLVISEYDPETAVVFEKKAHFERAEIIFATKKWKVVDEGIEDGKRNLTLTQLPDESVERYQLSLLGNYQLRNVLGIREAINQLQKQGWKISEEHIRTGLAQVQQNTGLMGRWQILQMSPLTICDTGHNEGGIKEVVTQLKSYSFKNLWLVWGMVRDKDPVKIIRLLPRNSVIIATQASIARAMPVAELAGHLKNEGFEPIEIESVPEALVYALQSANSDDLVFVGGSTFVVAEIPFEKFSGTR